MILLHHPKRNPCHLVPRIVHTTSAHIPKRQNLAAPRGPALTRTTRSLTNIPRNGMAHQQRTSRMRTDPSLRNPTKSKSPHPNRNPRHLVPRIVHTASAHIPKRQNLAAPRGPALTRTTRSLTNIPRNGMTHQQRTSRMRTDPSLRNPAKSKSPPSAHHQIAFMRASCGTSSLQGLYSQLMHMLKVERLAI